MLTQLARGLTARSGRDVSNPMRRAAEKPYVTGLSQLGIRNVSSTAREGYEAARAMGSGISIPPPSYLIERTSSP